MNQGDFRQEAIRVVVEHTELDAAAVDAALTVPPKPELGDFAFPCFLLAKRLKEAPPKIAAELASKINAGANQLELLEKVAGVGPYLNFTIRRDQFAKAVLGEAISAGEAYGRSAIGAGKVVAIDYSSPNIAKPFHVGHLRSTIIGNALYKIFSALGYKVVGINHLGDWGTQFGKQIVGLRRWGQPDDANELMSLNRLYVKYHEEAPGDASLDDEARDWFRRQEAGDQEALDLWRQIRETSLDYFKRIYDRLGVKFDHYIGESFFNDKMDAVLELAEKKGILQESDGARIVDLTAEGIETPGMMQKSDGATLYLTRDLAAAIYRQEAFQFEKLLYVVGTPQSLHFKQLFTVLKLLGYDWHEKCHHVNFGQVHGMATRKGSVVYLEELLDEAKDRALRYMRENIEKRTDVEDEEAVAEAVGIAAIFFSDLSKQRIKDYNFNWDHAIAFDGDTGPYLMYSYARIAGIIRKCGLTFSPGADATLLSEPEAYQLICRTAQFSDRLQEAARLYEPSVLANYLLELARALHSSYNVLRVKDAPDDVARARLMLFVVVKRVLKSGMEILGIPALERM